MELYSLDLKNPSTIREVYDEETCVNCSFCNNDFEDRFCEYSGSDNFMSDVDEFDTCKFFDKKPY